jgi:photosystem II stability/assembly factor-like uncharacterized protein
MSLLAGSPATLFVVPLTSDEVRLPVEGKLRAYRSHDGGDNWEVSGEGLPHNSYSAVLREALAAGAGNGSSVYFGTTSGELYGSWDAGDNWTRLPGVYPRILSVRAISI